MDIAESKTISSYDADELKFLSKREAQVINSPKDINILYAEGEIYVHVLGICD